LSIIILRILDSWYFDVLLAFRTNEPLTSKAASGSQALIAFRAEKFQSLV
jgi:hypothetical protein